MSSSARQPTHFFAFSLVGVAGLLTTLVLGGCQDSKAADAAAQQPTKLTLGAYTTPREAYAELLPAFRDVWSKQHPAGVTFQESYVGSGAQARAIVGGFEADVAALSLEPDIATLQTAGLVKDTWRQRARDGVVSRSVVVIGVRPGNPKQIHDWDDLAKPGIEVLTPNVRTSGGARWNIAAIWGAALRGKTAAPSGTPEAATKLLSGILANVKIMDSGARESLLTFERGVGDAIITYENEVLVGRKSGQPYEYVIPRSTILIENPVAVVDSYVDKHGTREAANALVDFLITPQAQRIFARHGLRPVDESVAAELSAEFPKVTDLFTVRDIGGWKGVNAGIFDKGSAYDNALSQAGKP